MAKISIIINANVPQEDLNTYWDHPADLVLNGFGTYYGSSDVHIFRVGDAVVESITPEENL